MCLKVSESVKKCFPGRPVQRTTDGKHFLRLPDTFKHTHVAMTKFPEILEFLNSMTP